MVRKRDKWDDEESEEFSDEDFYGTSKEDKDEESEEFSDEDFYGTSGEEDEGIRRCVSCGRPILVGSECVHCAMEHPGRATAGWAKWGTKKILGVEDERDTERRYSSCGRPIIAGGECMHCAMEHPGKAATGWAKWGMKKNIWW